jgi:hypothetical protein
VGRFQLRQKVRVTDGYDPRLNGMTGSVCRLLHRDSSAWIDMDQDVPSDLANFIDGDPRRNHINVFPDECELVEEETV